MKKSLKVLAAALVLALSPSCMQLQPTAKETIPEAEVVLAKKNFRVVATQVSGEDTGFALFTGVQAFTRLLSIYPFWDVSTLPTGITLDPISESKALDDLYKNSGANVTGRSTQLINVRKEYGGFNAFIFGRPKIRYTADLIEFCSPGSVGVTQTEAKPEAASTATPPPAPQKKTSKKRRR